MNKQTSKTNKILNISLLISFVLTIMVPLTGIHIHKLASLIFLILSIVHTLIYRKKMGAKRYWMLAVIIVSFFSGIFGMIFDHYPIVMQFHRAISIASVFFIAIHIFVFHKRLNLKPRLAMER